MFLRLTFLISLIVTLSPVGAFGATSGCAQKNEIQYIAINIENAALFSQPSSQDLNSGAILPGNPIAILSDDGTSDYLRATICLSGGQRIDGWIWRKHVRPRIVLGLEARDPETVFLACRNGSDYIFDADVAHPKEYTLRKTGDREVFFIFLVLEQKRFALVDPREATRAWKTIKRVAPLELTLSGTGDDDVKGSFALSTLDRETGDYVDTRIARGENWYAHFESIAECEPVSAWSVISEASRRKF